MPFLNFVNKGTNARLFEIHCAPREIQGDEMPRQESQFEQVWLLGMGTDWPCFDLEICIGSAVPNTFSKQRSLFGRRVAALLLDLPPKEFRLHCAVPTEPGINQQQLSLIHISEPT